MTEKNLNKLIEANADALRKVAALLEAVASLVDTRDAKMANDHESVPVAFDPMAPTRKMQHMEQHALALDEAVRGVAIAVEKLEAEPLEIPLPEIETVKINRPEQMADLMAKLGAPPETDEEIVNPPGSIIEVEPVGAPETKKMGSRTGMPPGIRNPKSFGRSHPK